jgi:molecular chaperone GrpE
MASEKENIAEENEEVKTEQEEVSSENTEESTPDSENQNETEEESEFEKLEKENKELSEKYIRLYSEFENFRRRSAKEKIDIINNAGEKILKDVIPVLDDFERAIESNKKNDNIDSIKEGFELVHNKLFGVLTNNGLEPMNSKGKEFDVDEHEALTKIPAPSKKEEGKVVDVIEKGYYLNGKVLRFAKVVIGE